MTDGKKNNFQSLVENTISSLNAMASANTIFGDAYKTEGGETIIPVSKVVVGYVVGGGEYSETSKRKKNENLPMAAGSGGGISLVPEGYILDNKKEIKYVSTKQKDEFDFIYKIFSETLKFLENFKKKD